MIEVKNLTKKFGDFTAVDSLSFYVGDGEFLGILGPNGAGKTTTINMLSTLLLPTSGELWIDGERLKRGRTDIKQKISLITQEYSLQRDLSVDEIMELQGRLYHIPSSKRRKRTEELLEFCGLSGDRKKKVSELSGGMKRKLMLGRALLTEPKILILDEPTVGIDTISRKQFEGLLKTLSVQGLSIIMTTHYLQEAQDMCQRVIFIDHGKCICSDTPENLILELGETTVEEASETEVKCKYFKGKAEAKAYAMNLSGHFSIRHTTLDDVFLAKLKK